MNSERQHKNMRISYMIVGTIMKDGKLLHTKNIIWIPTKKMEIPRIFTDGQNAQF